MTETATPNIGIREWALPAAIIVAVEYAFALAIGAKVGFRYQIPFVAYALIGSSIACGGIAVFSLKRAIGYARNGVRRPWRELLRDLPACSGFVVGTLLVGVQMAVLTWTKIMLPLAVPFWAGPYLAGFDRAVFGTDPWRVVEALFGWAAATIDGTYMTWILFKFTTLAILLAAPESRTKAQALLAYFLIMASTAVGQYALSSAGPIFYNRLGFGTEYADLPIEPWVRVTSAYLWHDYLHVGGDIGSGISAMPSLHVAIALWIAFVMRAYAPRWAFLGFGYYALICIGSVLLGWHYAADGFAATAITLVSWRLAGRVLASDLSARVWRRERKWSSAEAA